MGLLEHPLLPCYRVPMVDSQTSSKIINVRLDPELWARAKAQAAHEDRTLVSWLARAIRAALDHDRAPGTAGRSRAPVLNAEARGTRINGQS